MKNFLDDKIRDEQKKIYSEYYKERSFNNHNYAKLYLVERLNKELKEMALQKDKLVMLDLGAGRQSLERWLEAMYSEQPYFSKLNIFTLDIASIERKQLLTDNQHIAADVLQLPTQDNSVDLVVSNKTIEYFSSEVLREIYRVLIKGGKGVFTFNVPGENKRLFDDKLKAEVILKKSIAEKSITELKAILSDIGFQVSYIKNKEFRGEQWREIKVIKDDR